LLGQGGSRNALYLAGEALISLAAPVVFAIVAALIVSRQPRNTIGWVLMVPVGLYVVSGPVASYIESLAPSSPEPTVPLLLMLWFNNWNWLLLFSRCYSSRCSFQTDGRQHHAGAGLE